MPNPLRLNIEAIRTDYSIDKLFDLAMEQNIFLSERDNCEPETITYTLKQLTLMPFEDWAYLIEMENTTNND